jgi:endo-1,4-beta-D-glucanase Y
MDMAYALILAHRQWGDQQYLEDARAIIASIKELNFHLNNPDHPNESIAQYRTNLGDWHGRWGSNTLASRTTSRTSDWMPGHFRAFHAATGDNFWLSAADEVYSLLRQVSHTGTGLMPDFIIDVPARVVASAAEAVVAGEHNWYNYAFNACRVPWRLALDFVHNGNADARTQINTISNWLRGATNANPGEIAQGYNVDGTVVTSGFAMAFTAPFAAGMLGDTRNQTFLNATYSALASRQGSSFYNDALRLLSLLLVTGNWWAP